MRTLAIGMSLGVALALLGDPPSLPSREPPPEVARSAAALHTTSIESPALTRVVVQYCQVCHNDALLTGNVSLQGFEVERAPEQAETAERMIRKLRAGMMPPPDMPRPGGDTLDVLVATLEQLVDEAAVSRPNPGVRRFQRLSRAEYERVVHDMLDLEIDAGRWLPADVLLGSFDNLSAAQGLSTTLLASYMRAATEISRLAVGNRDAVSVSAKYTNPIEVSQHAWDQLEGAPFGTRGGMVLTHDFPADGEYVLTVETLFGQGTGFEDLDISIDGEGVAVLPIPHNGERAVPLSTDPIFVRAGQHRVAAAFVRRMDGPYDDRFSPFDWSFVGGEDAQQWANYGITALPHLANVMITGPTTVAGVSDTPSRSRIFSCRPASESDERPCARSIVARLAGQAYRRPVTDEDVQGLMAFYDQGSEGGGFEIGVRTALQALLASPSFVFRLEREPSGTGEGENYYLSDLDLASRLSFLLWASAPDQELLDLAANGRLSDDAVLEAQVQRMLADPRSEALGTRFAHQWLRLQDAAKNNPEPYLYPDFTGQLSDALVRETELFFNHLVQEDRSLLEFFDADYSFLNERVARHYGIDGVTGDDFRLVAYPDDKRRGILSHGSVLLLTSMSGRTSPVLRGKWVMEVLMGTPPPPPPPNIPAFDQTEGVADGRRLTTRERMERHRANPTCNACHRFMDPIGLALDNYDVTGRWRIRENMVALDTRGDYYDGTSITTPSELTRVILKRPVPLVRNFTAHLLAYAIGRRVEYFDQPAIRVIANDAETEGYRMSSFILGVVKTDPFRMRRTEATADAEASQGM